MSISLEEQVLKNYQDNLDYFKQEQLRVYDKIIAFESAIEYGHYKPRYELEYKDESFFDVKEIETGKYFYVVNSNLYAKKAKQLVNYKKEESSFKTFYDYTFTQEELDYYEKQNIENSAYYAYSKIMHYTKNIMPTDPQMKHIKKFVFFGVGLGMHLVEIDKKIEAENYLIVEDDLELFRLSMFTTNYKKLAKKKRLFFCIFEEDNDARQIFELFLEKSFYYNQYIKYFQMQSSDDSKMKALHTTIIGQRHLVFLYNAYFKVFLRALDYLKNGYNFLDMSAKDIKIDTFSNKPVILVAAGPSLSKNLDWLEKNKDRFIIVALTASLKTLEKRNIKPDIITHLDPFEKTCMIHIDSLENQDFIKDCILLCGSQTPKILINRFQKDKVFIAQVSTNYKKDLGSIEPICVGSATYMMLINLGVKNLYTLGLDLALDKDTGLSHTKEHAYTRKLDISKNDEIEDHLGYKKATVKVKGNFDETRYATLTFHKSITAINSFSKVRKKEFQNVFNLNDGAYLEGFIPTKISSLDIKNLKKIDKNQYMKLIHNNLLQKSSNKLSEDEINSMKRRREYATELIEKISKHKYPQAFNSVVYQSQLLSLTLDILDGYDKEAVDLHNMFLTYLHFILPFVFDMLNTRDLKNEKKHIKYIHSLLIKYCLEIATYYKEEIDKFFEEEKLEEIN